MKADKFSPGDDVTEPLLKQLDLDIWQNYEKPCPTITERDEKKDSKLLILSFVAMVFVGLGNKVMQKVQTEPMKNYPYFLNIYTTFIFIPASFVYIFPMIMLGKLSEARKEVPQFKVIVRVCSFHGHNLNRFLCAVLGHGILGRFCEHYANFRRDQNRLRLPSHLTFTG
jgi:hypothetical protein